MSPDRLRQLTVVLVVLIVLWGTAKLLRGGDDSSSDEFELPVLDTSQVQSVRLLSPTDSITLTRDSTGWRVNGYEADQGLVTSFLGVWAMDSSRAQLVSVSATSHERMGVDSLSGRFLTIVSTERVLPELVFGESARGFRTVYARRVGSDNTFQLTSAVVDHLTRGLNDWRDKTILTLQPESVATVEMSRGGVLTVLTRRDGAWSFRRGSQPADSMAVKRMIERYRNFRANGFAYEEDEPAPDLDNPDLFVRLLTASGDTLAAVAFDSTGGDFYVQANDNDQVYKVASWSIPQLVPADSTLRANR